MITRSLTGGVAVLTLDRHERRNALDLEHCDALRRELATVLDDGARAVVVTGAGSSFSAGADLDSVYGVEFRSSLTAMLAAFVAAPVPVIAAVGGPAIGAGTQLAIACDLRVVAAGARFGVPTARNGLAVDGWTVRRLGLLAGVGPARAMLLGVDTLSADRALACGLADRAGDLDVALAWAAEIAALAPLSLAYSKLALTAVFEDAAVTPASDAAFAACWASSDVDEARRARSEKRAPRFTGR